MDDSAGFRGLVGRVPTLVFAATTFLLYAPFPALWLAVVIAAADTGEGAWVLVVSSLLPTALLLLLFGALALPLAAYLGRRAARPWVLLLLLLAILIAVLFVAADVNEQLLTSRFALPVHPELYSLFMTGRELVLVNALVGSGLIAAAISYAYRVEPPIWRAWGVIVIAALGLWSLAPMAVNLVYALIFELGR